MAKKLNERGKQYEALLHRLVSVMLFPDGSEAGQAVANLQRAAELKLMGGFYEEARKLAAQYIAGIRFSKGDLYREKSDEEIAAIIMQAIREKDQEILKHVR